MPANRCGGFDVAINALSGYHGFAGPGVVTLATVFDSVANARLIAAAPELLAALESALPNLECHALDCHRDGLSNAARVADAAIASARAAIAKAKGVAL